MTPSIVALIPARSGSKRIPHKNVKELSGKPLLVWTIEAARASGIFERIFVSTESVSYLDIIYEHSAVWIERPREFAQDDSPDFEWTRHALDKMHHRWALMPDAFAILRPTSPFRTADTIRRAWQQFLENQPCDSLRAVEKVKQHPGKMWKLVEQLVYDAERPTREHIEPLVPLKSEETGQPWHSSPTQVLPTYYVQNASLEIAWIKTVLEKGTIAGDVVIPFFTEGIEGFDINTPEDWAEAERIAAAMKVYA